MGDVEILVLPCLASEHNSNIPIEDMADLRRQGINVNNENDPAPKIFLTLENIPLTQLEEDNSWISEVIICSRQWNNLLNTNAPFKKYTHEEVMKMTNLELFLVLFYVTYLKKIPISEK